MGALIGPLLIFGLSRGLTRAQRRFIVPVLLVALALRMASSTLFAAFPSLRIFHEDAEGYEEYGFRLASIWLHDGPPMPVDIPGRNSGYLHVVAAVYYVFGRYRLNATIFNSIIGTLNVMLVFRIGLNLFHEAVARRGALLSAFAPSMIIWSSVALKDPVMSFLICLTVYYCIRLRDHFSLINMTGSVLPIILTYPIRFYMVFFLLIATLGTMAIKRSGKILSGLSKQAVMLGLLLAVVTALGLSSTWLKDYSDFFTLERASDFRRNMAITAQSGFSSDVDISSPLGAVLFLPVGIVTLLWAPFPWQMTSLRPLLTLPEMLVWWYCAGALLRGLWYALRVRARELSPVLVFTGITTVAYSLIMGNVGAGFRHRAQIFNLLFLLVALGQYLKVARRKGINPALLVNRSGAARQPAQPAPASVRAAS